MRAFLLLALIFAFSEAFKCYSQKAIFSSLELTNTIDCPAQVTSCLIKPGKINIFDCDTQNECQDLEENSCNHDMSLCCCSDVELCNTKQTIGKLAGNGGSSTESNPSSVMPIKSSTPKSTTTIATTTATTTTTHKGGFALSASLLTLFVTVMY